MGGAYQGSVKCFDSAYVADNYQINLYSNFSFFEDLYGVKRMNQKDPRTFVYASLTFIQSNISVFTV